MRDSRRHIRHLVALLQSRLPLPARAGASLVATARAACSNPRLSPRCSVTQIYDAGDQLGLMCRLEFKDRADAATIFVASIMQLSFDRKCSISHEILAYQKWRRETRVVTNPVAESLDDIAKVGIVSEASGRRRSSAFRAGAQIGAAGGAP